MMDVYKLYNFKFDKDKAVEGLRQALIDKGLDNKHKFVNFVLKYYPDKSKATLEEYYTRRLCNDNEILKLLHDELNINLQEVFLPNSYCKSKIVINEPVVSYMYKMEILNNIEIVIYNSEKLNKNSCDEEFEFFYEALDNLIYIYGYYNYLFQKYINSYLSSREKDILDLFVDTPLTSYKTIYKYIEDNKGKNNIFKSYYDNNTLCQFDNDKHYLLKYIEIFDIVSEDKLLDLICIIPPREKNILYTIYKNINNEKMADALSNFNVKELNNIEIINNNVFDTLNNLFNEGVL